MFRFFEKQVAPYPGQEPKVPPKGFFAFVWACTQGMRGWIGLMTLTSALLAAYEAVLFAIMGRVVDWLGTVSPANFWAEQQATLPSRMAAMPSTMVCCSAQKLAGETVPSQSTTRPMMANSTAS